MGGSAKYNIFTVNIKVLFDFKQLSKGGFQTKQKSREFSLTGEGGVSPQFPSPVYFIIDFVKEWIK